MTTLEIILLVLLILSFIRGCYLGNQRWKLSEENENLRELLRMMQESILEISSRARKEIERLNKIINE